MTALFPCVVRESEFVRCWLLSISNSSQLSIHVAKATRQALCVEREGCKPVAWLVSEQAGASATGLLFRPEFAHTANADQPSNNKGQDGRKQQKEQMLFFTLVTGAARNLPFRTLQTTHSKKQGPTGIVWVIVVLHSWAPGTVLRHSLFKACQRDGDEHGSLGSARRVHKTVHPEQNPDVVPCLSVWR
jgi:hypothetical protein